MSEALLLAEHGENMFCTKIVLNVRNNFRTQHVLPRFELGIFVYWTCNSMNNLSSYCGLVDAKIRVPDKDLPVQGKVEIDHLLLIYFWELSIWFPPLQYKSWQPRFLWTSYQTYATYCSSWAQVNLLWKRGGFCYFVPSIGRTGSINNFKCLI